MGNAMTAQTWKRARSTAQSSNRSGRARMEPLVPVWMIALLSVMKTLTRRFCLC